MSASKKTVAIEMAVIAAVAGLVIGALAMRIWLINSDLRTSQQRGRDIAVLVCAQCHAVRKTGKSPRTGAPPFRTLIGKFTEEGMREQLDLALSLEHKPMPPWKFSSEQVNDLMAYLVQLSQSN